MYHDGRFNKMERSDYKTMLEAVRNNPNNIVYGSRTIKDNKEIAMLAIRGEQPGNNEPLFARLSPRLRDDYQVVKASVEKNGMCLRYASLRLRGNIEIVKAAMLSSNGECISLVSFDLRDNQNFATWAVEKFPRSYAHLSERLRSDVRLLQLGMDQEPEIFSHAPGGLRDDPNVVASAISRSANNLRYASDRLRNDEDIVKFGLVENSGCLKYASDRLRDNDEIVKFAVVRGACAFYYASDRLRDNEEMAMKTIGKDVGFFAASSRICRCRDFVIASIVANDNIPDEILYEYRDDDEIFGLLVNKNPLKLEHASARIKDGPLAVRAVKLNYLCLQYVSDRLQHDFELVLKALDSRVGYAGCIPHPAMIYNKLDYIP